MLETVFLDAGGVLVTPNWQRVSATLGRHGVNVAATALAAADPHARREVDLRVGGGPSTDEQRGWTYFNLVLARAGVSISDRTEAALTELRQYHAERNLWERIIDGVPEALERLAAGGLRLVVVSNANGTLCDHFDRLGFTRYFTCVLDSCDVGIEKPDPRFFQHALERAGARPETTMHVGDLYYVDVVGARAAGLRAMLVDEAHLYADFDCDRVSTIRELPDRLGV